MTRSDGIEVHRSKDGHLTTIRWPTVPETDRNVLGLFMGGGMMLLGGGGGIEALTRPGASSDSVLLAAGFLSVFGAILFFASGAASLFHTPRSELALDGRGKDMVLRPRAHNGPGRALPARELVELTVRQNDRDAFDLFARQADGVERLLVRCVSERQASAIKKEISNAIRSDA